LALALAAVGILVFGAIIEKRTALRRVPMTDLGVFSCAASAVQTGGNLYTTTDWHGWHYHYPPALAILFAPLAHPPPASATLAQGTRRLDGTTLWGYEPSVGPNFYGLHAENRRFFFIVAIWYLLSVGMALLAAHLLASTLGGSSWRSPPPAEADQRRQWWQLRLAPLLLCIVSVGTDLSRGQVDLLMLLAVALALYCIARRRDWVGGMFASMPAAVKLFPALLLLLPLWWRRWRLGAGIGLGLLVLVVLVPAGALGPARTTEAYRTWLSVLVKPGLGTGTDSSRAVELTNFNGTDNQSLLAFLHNWTFRHLPREQRPAQASPAARHAVSAIGGVMLVALALGVGLRRRESARDLVLLGGILLALSLVLSPTVHNYYYLMLMPLLAALVAHVLESPRQSERRLVVAALLLFMVTDFLARLPGIGPSLRDLGAPLLSLLLVTALGALVLCRRAPAVERPSSLAAQ
jgi:hypothetical protein